MGKGSCIAPAAPQCIGWKAELRERERKAMHDVVEMNIRDAQDRLDGQLTARARYDAEEDLAYWVARRMEIA